MNELEMLREENRRLRESNTCLSEELETYMAENAELRLEKAELKQELRQRGASVQLEMLQQTNRLRQLGSDPFSSATVSGTSSKSHTPTNPPSSPLALSDDESEQDEQDCRSEDEARWEEGSVPTVPSQPTESTTDIGDSQLDPIVWNRADSAAISSYEARIRELEHKLQDAGIEYESKVWKTAAS